MESREALCDVWDNGTIIRMEAKLTKWGFFLLSKIFFLHACNVETFVLSAL